MACVPSYEAPGTLTFNSPDTTPIRYLHGQAKSKSPHAAWWRGWSVTRQRSEQ